MRDYKLDLVRGFAILLVVIGHVVQYQDLDNYRTSLLFSLIYSFHMPLFFFLSGRVFGLYGANNFSLRYYRKKAVGIAVPWAIWTLIIYALKPGDLGYYIQFYWFLPVLLICFSVIYIAKLSLLLYPSRMIIYSIIILFWLILFCIDGFWFSSVRYHLIFFWCGFFLLHKYDIVEFIRSHLASRYIIYVLASVVFISVFNGLLYEWNLSKFFAFALKVYMAAVLIVATWCIVPLVHKNIKFIFNLLGCYSMQIYLIHLLLIQFIGIANTMTAVLFALLFLLGFPLLIARLFEKWGGMNKLLFGR